MTTVDEKNGVCDQDRLIITCYKDTVTKSDCRDISCDHAGASAVAPGPGELLPRVLGGTLATP